VDIIKEKVDDIVNRYGTRSPFKIAAAKGITVLFEPLGNILGYYSRHFRIPLIHINESSPKKEQEFVCGHELGHAILHPDSNTPFLKKNTYFPTEKIEIEANAFAMELLFGGTEDSITIAEAMKEYRIPEKVLRNFLV
jgi:Zn-dependent peptidase ImmA (M78 family)